MIKIGNLDVDLYMGNIPVSSVYLGNLLVWKRDAGEGGGEGGGETQVMAITSIVVSEIPANGGSVSSCIINYRYNGEDKQVTRNFTAVTAEAIGAFVKERTLIDTKVIDTSMLGDGSVPSVNVEIYQRENKLEKITTAPTPYDFVAGLLDSDGRELTSSVSKEAGYVCVYGYVKTHKYEEYTSLAKKYLDDVVSYVQPAFETDGVVCTSVGEEINIGGGAYGFKANISKNDTDVARTGWVKASYTGLNAVTLKIEQEKGDQIKTAKEYLDVELTSVGYDAYSVIITNTSSKNIKFVYQIGSKQFEVVLNAGGVYHDGGVWRGIVSAEFTDEEGVDQS